MPASLNRVESGSGPTVVLIHGFPEFWYAWRKQIPPLNAAGFHTVAIDLPGYNDSPKPREVEAYRMTSVVGQVTALIEEVGPPVSLIGHDWGALVSWLVAMTRPQLLSKMAILNVPHPAAFAREMRRSVLQRMRMLYQAFFWPPFIPEVLLPRLLPGMMALFGRLNADELREYRRAWSKSGAPRGMANYYRAIRRFRGELGKLIRPVQIPTLLIWADREPVFQRGCSENLEEWVPNLRLARVADAGHFVQTDQPERVAEILIGFLADSLR